MYPVRAIGMYGDERYEFVYYVHGYYTVPDSRAFAAESHGPRAGGIWE